MNPAEPAGALSLDRMPAAWRGAVVAIGNFDGVHRGHQAVLTAALAEAERRAVPCVMLTFEPHPRAFFSGRPLFRLTPAPLKAALATALGLDGSIVLPFDAALAGMEAATFVGEILVGRMAIGAAVTGADFHFGRARRGTPDFLRREAGRHGFAVTVVDPATDGPEPVSSTRIRDALAAADVATARRLLGRGFAFSGTVIHGEARGRTLGYPTANMAMDPAFGLAQGIYAVRYLRPNGRLHDGVASYGRRPTFDDGRPIFETFLFDFSGNLYGEEALVSVGGFIRPEERFASVAALIARMDEDSLVARGALAGEAEGELDLRLHKVWADQALASGAPRRDTATVAAP